MEERDPRIKCIKCGYPVDFPSMGGRDLCGWCDSGQPRPEERHWCSESCDDCIKKAVEIANTIPEEPPNN